MSENKMEFAHQFDGEGGLFVLDEREAGLAIQGAKRLGLRVYVLSARKYDSYRDLLRDLAKVLSFPSYFGVNWDALKDSLFEAVIRDGKGTLLVIERAYNLLSMNKGEVQTLRQVFESVVGLAESHKATLAIVLVGSAELNQALS